MFQIEVLICLVLTRNDMNVNAAMYSSENGEVGNALQKGFNLAYNVYHRSNKVTEGVVLLHSHTGIVIASPTL
jgi:hypothetical protein